MTATDHLGSLPFSGDAASFPSHAELVRTLLGEGGMATLTTVTETGHPYGSLVAYSTLQDGSPLVCISELAEHTKNARRDAKAGVFVAAPVHGDADPMDAPRVSIIGNLRIVEPDPSAVADHVRLHPGVADYESWNDFNWWQLTIESARYVGGFGMMSWIKGGVIADAEPDPVIPHAVPAIEHMNADHADANLSIATELGGVTEATAARVRDIDRYGMTFYVDTPSGLTLSRVAFDRRLDDPAEVRSAVVALTHRARGEQS